MGSLERLALVIRAIWGAGGKQHVLQRGVQQHDTEFVVIGSYAGEFGFGRCENDGSRRRCSSAESRIEMHEISSCGYVFDHQCKRFFFAKFS